MALSSLLDLFVLASSHVQFLVTRLEVSTNISSQYMKEPCVDNFIASYGFLCTHI